MREILLSGYALFLRKCGGKRNAKLEFEHSDNLQTNQ